MIVRNQCTMKFQLWLGCSCIISLIGISKSICPFKNIGFLSGDNNKRPLVENCTFTTEICQKYRYRTFSGVCNNLKYPRLGIPISTFARLLPPNYEDGISSLPKTKSGKDLPNARKLSTGIFPSENNPDPAWTLNCMQFGQFVAHDLILTARSAVIGSETSCCNNGKIVKNRDEDCDLIKVPKDDELYQKAGIECLHLHRGVTDLYLQKEVDPKEPAEQVNAISSYMDLSNIYGDTTDGVDLVRAYVDGKLKTESRFNQHWPVRHPEPKKACFDMRSKDEPCYAGEARVNQNPQLAILHIIFLREHNRIAAHLAELNPQWDDETIFQEARNILIAVYQYITYYEWLPILLGRNNLIKKKIIYETSDYVDDYNPNKNSRILGEFASAAFRYCHTLISGNLLLVPTLSNITNSEDTTSAQGIRLSDWITRPAILEQYDGQGFDMLANSLLSQPQESADRFHTDEITNFFGKGEKQFGSDLKAMDIQRNRETGNRFYNDYRERAGLSRAKSFDDFSDVIHPRDVELLKKFYEDPDDVELSIGGNLEKQTTGLIGPTFQSIMIEQFFRIRTADRFWFESSSSPSAFTLEQLNSIRNVTIARLFCDNVNSIEVAPKSGFARISTSNPTVSCDDIPSLNLALWKA